MELLMKMSIELILQVATFISAFAAVASVAVGVRMYSRQVNAQIFLEYSKRHREVMADFPELARRYLDSGGRDQLPERTPALSAAVLGYLNLCSEEHFLYRHGYIARPVWNVWSSEMERRFRDGLIAREWADLREEYKSDAEFQRYVDQSVPGESSNSG